LHMKIRRKLIYDHSIWKTCIIKEYYVLINRHNNSFAKTHVAYIQKVNLKSISEL